MTETKFSSILAPYIEGHIKEKRALGYDYKTNEEHLLRFDRYCTERNLSTTNLTKEFLDDWCVRLETEELCSQRSRISAVRQLCTYMASTGLEVYMPKFTGHVDIVLPHILTNDELLAFFHEVDSYKPITNRIADKRIACEYCVLFRMLYCCGLRNSEGSGIAAEYVDLKNGVLDIIDAKGHKDRRVYMADDLTGLCREYYEYICDKLHCYSQWFFPSRDPQKPLRNTSVDRAFSRFWNQTEYASKTSNKPTVHDLRFTFITDRINEWASQGVDIEVMMAYLEKYVGHQNLQDSYYYYHVTEDLYRSIEDKDKTSESLIPEVKKDE